MAHFVGSWVIASKKWFHKDCIENKDQPHTSHDGMSRHLFGSSTGKGDGSEIMHNRSSDLIKQKSAGQHKLDMHVPGVF